MPVGGQWQLGVLEGLEGCGEFGEGVVVGVVVFGMRADVGEGDFNNFEGRRHCEGWAG